MSTNGHAPVADDESEVTKAAPTIGTAGPYVELGTSGLVHFNGILADEPLRELQGREGTRTYREMTTDPIIGGALLAIDNLVRRVEWTFDPADDPGPDGERWADLCNMSMSDMSSTWDDTISEIFTMVPYGWAYCEVVPKRRNGEQPDTPNAPPSSDYDDGLVGWRKIALRSQDSLLRWEIEGSSIRGMWQQVINGPAVFIPIERAGLFRTVSHRNSPEGVSVFRSAYKPWFLKQRAEVLEGIGIERDLAGLPIAGVPATKLTSTASDADKAMVQAILRIVTNVRRNSTEGMVFPVEYDNNGNEQYYFKLLASGGQRQIDVGKTIGRYDQAMAICVLADWLLLGHSAVGSRALADPKVNMFNSALATWNQSVGKVFDSHITPRLMRLNGVPAKYAPRLRPGPVAKADIEKFASAMSDLIHYGVLTHDDRLESYVRDELNLPPREEATSQPTSDATMGAVAPTSGDTATVPAAPGQQGAGRSAPVRPSSADGSPPITVIPAA